MKKKILLGLVAAGTAVAVLPLFAAFEAHVINVTAKIENALSVPLEHIDFGTVFPQELLEQPLDIWLSDSFLAEDRVDDVDYIIRQKPKCGVTTLDGRELVEGSTATGHVIPDGQGGFTVECGESPVAFDDSTHVYGELPFLCPYLSKHKDPQDDDGNDGELDSFHEAFTVSSTTVFWNDVSGHLAKSENDEHDNWIIDLAVPCFGDHCAQDWADFVAGVNPQADPDAYIQPIENEHKIFGCDLWVEVGGISLPPGLGCEDEIDVMLVLDRSGSIDSTELATMKSAAKAFVDALSPTSAGPHVGMVSFSTSASLDEHLTDDGSAVKTAIDAIFSGGLTNLEDGIRTASTELENPGDGHDRADAGSPDFILIITDGIPTASDGPGSDSDDAADAADDARSMGSEIFVVGVGTTGSTATFLEDEIADDSDHYFDSADFDDLEAILAGLVSCTP
jgi:uncharacterized protein YegL